MFRRLNSSWKKTNVDWKTSELLLLKAVASIAMSWVKCSNLLYFSRFLQSHAINHALLVESPYIVGQRRKFLEKIQQYRTQGRSIYYFDESYLNVHHSPSKILTDTTISSAKDADEKGLTTGIPRPAGKGARVIMIGIGSKDGFVPGTADIWKHTKKEGELSQDYHRDINGDSFNEWLDIVLPKLPEGSVLVRKF